MKSSSFPGFDLNNANLASKDDEEPHDDSDSKLEDGYRVLKGIRRFKQVRARS